MQPGFRRGHPSASSCQSQQSLQLLRKSEVFRFNSLAGASLKKVLSVLDLPRSHAPRPSGHRCRREFAPACGLARPNRARGPVHGGREEGACRWSLSHRACWSLLSDFGHAVLVCIRCLQVFERLDWHLRENLPPLNCEKIQILQKTLCLKGVLFAMLSAFLFWIASSSLVLLQHELPAIKPAVQAGVRFASRRTDGPRSIRRAGAWHL